MDAKKQVEARIKEAGGVMQLAALTGVPRENIYNLKRGKWPMGKTAEALGMKLIIIGKLK
jgi:hypothetical protein